jgi:hypothetical protein
VERQKIMAFLRAGHKTPQGVVAGLVAAAPFEDDGFADTLLYI